jgi:hypothetical protein
MVWHAVRTYAQLAIRRTYLGWRGRLRREGDGARCGGVVRLGGEAPASFYGRHGTRGQQQVARVASSPPCASPGQLLDSEVAATAGSNGGRGARVLAAARARAKVAARVWRKTQGGAARLIKAGRPPWRAGQVREGVHAASAGGSRTRA